AHEARQVRLMVLLWAEHAGMPIIDIWYVTGLPNRKTRTPHGLALSRRRDARAPRRRRRRSQPERLRLCPDPRTDAGGKAASGYRPPGTEARRHAGDFAHPGPRGARS